MFRLWPRLFSILVCAGLLIVPVEGRCAGSLVLLDAAPAESTLAVGASLHAWPDSTNTGRSSTRLWPAFDYYSHSGFFASTDDAVGWNLSRREAFQYGLRLWPQPGRDISRLPAGLDGFGTRIQPQAFANWQVWPALLLQSGYAYGAGRHHDGQQLELGATTGFPVGEGGLVGIGIAANYADRAFRNAYFGITPQEAVRTQLAARAIGSGWQDRSVLLSFEQKLGGHWRLDGQVLQSWLLGGAAESPLAQHRISHAATLSLWYEF